MNTWQFILLGIPILSLFLVWDRFFYMRSKSTEELRAILRGTEWMYYHNALKELQRRGEDIKAEVVPVLHLLISDSKYQRIGGWMILRSVYSDLATRVDGYKPEESLAICKEKLERIFLKAA